MSDHQSKMGTGEKAQVTTTCAKCRFPITPRGREGSFTAFLFSDLRCKCDVATPVPSFTNEIAENKLLDGGAVALRPPIPEGWPDLGARYEVLELVGQGGMGAVWKICDRETNKTLAAKLLRTELVVDPIAVKRFEQEVQAATCLNHANLVVVYGSGTAVNGEPYLLMDFLEGQSLAEVLKKDGHMEATRLLDISIQVCEALSHAHSKGIVHRDVKPSNIILVSDDRSNEIVKLVDFGIAKILPSINEQTANLTRTGDLFGSPFYMSPEQCRGEAIDCRSDFYSLGCVMYEALTGTTPFAADNTVKTILAHLNEPPAPIDRPFALSKDVEDVVMMCLEKYPDDRYQFASQLIDDLSLVRSGQIPRTRMQFTNRKKTKVFFQNVRKQSNNLFWFVVFFAGTITLNMGLEHFLHTSASKVGKKQAVQGQSTIRGLKEENPGE